MPYLDKDGLDALWTKIKANFGHTLSKTSSSTAVNIALKTTSNGTLNSVDINKSDITALGIPAADTHYTSKNVAGSTSSATANAAASNGSVYLNSVENGAVTSANLIKGTGATTAANARSNLGAAAASHNHDAGNITSGALAIARGGTGATTAANARSNLGITCANLGAVGKPRVLFTHDGWTGTKTYLSSAIYNFDIIEVFFITNDGCEGSARGFNGKSGTLYMDLAAMHPTSTSESGIFKFRQVEFSALEMTSSRCCEMAAYSESFKLQESTNAIKIIKVLGWNIS